MRNKFVILLVTWFYAGRVPKAPGTAGSLAALPFAYLMQSAWGNVALLVASTCAFFVGWWASHVYMRAQKICPPPNLPPQAGGGNKCDPQEIVIDEVAGQWLLLAAMPLSLTSYLVGFILFRFFDALKPWPVSLADRRIKGALGVMLDDILAAAYPVVIAVAAIYAAQALGYDVSVNDAMAWLAGEHVF